MEQAYNIKDANLYELLEVLAFQQAATDAHSVGCNSRFARVVPDSWQARLFAQMPDVRHVSDLADFARAMAEPSSPVLFIANHVTIDAAAIARACAHSGHDKAIVWEDGGFA